jgi:hypothetical protein
MTQTATPIGRIMLKNVRLSFAQGLFAATVMPGSDANAKPKFNCGIILPPDHPQLEEVRKKMRAVALDKWKDKADAQYKALEKSDKLALHDGDNKPSYDGYPGNFFLSPSAQESSPPTLLSPAKQALSPKDAKQMLYSGCYVNVSIDIWAQDNNFGKRINAQLRGVQFVRDGEAFSSGRPADTDEFEAVTEGADAEDFA